MKLLLTLLTALFLFVPLLSFGEETGNKYPVIQYQNFLLPSGIYFVAPKIIYLDFPPNMPIRGKLDLYIDFFAQQYTVPADLLTQVINCESRFNIKAIGKAGEIGIAQFMPKTWGYFLKQYGKDLDIENSFHQIELMSWAFSRNYQSHWTCFKLVRK